MRSILHHPICKWLLVGAALAGIALTAFTTMARVPINSDFANHVLEGQDWIGGNFFLKDWDARPLDGQAHLGDQGVRHRAAEGGAEVGEGRFPNQRLPRP